MYNPKSDWKTEVLALPEQCGMNYLYNLNRSKTLKEQIEVLDYAFSHWGIGWIHGGTKDEKSQVIFTDTVDAEENRWPLFKKLAARGPATKNRRYDPRDAKEIVVYVLTWEVYSKWKEEHEKEQNVKKKEVKEEVKEVST